MPPTLPWDETFGIGADTCMPIDDCNHQVLFKFTGKIDKLSITWARPKLTPEDKKQLMEAAVKAADRP